MGFLAAPPSEEEDSQDLYHQVSESEEESEHCQEELSNLQALCPCCPTRNSWYEPSYGPVLEQDHGVDTNIFLPEFDKYSIKTHTKSHFYQSLGFCLYQREDIIVWTDLDLEYIQKNNYVIFILLAHARNIDNHLQAKPCEHDTFGVLSQTDVTD